MAQYYLESAWDTIPDNTSTFEFYNPDDQLIVGNGIDSTQKYDGTQFVDLGGGAPKGKIPFVYKDRLIITADPNFPHRLWISHIRNGEGWSKSFDWIDVNPDDGGAINGAIVQNDEAIISKDNGRKYGFQIFADGDLNNSRLRKIEDDKGNVNFKAETILEDVDYFLDRNAIFTIPKGSKGGISYVVQEIIDSIDPAWLKEASLGSNDGKVYISLGDIDIDIEEGITLNGAVLVYDSINEAFYLRDETDARVFSRFVDTTGNEQLYFGSNTGKVFKLNDGYLAGTNPIHMRIRTKPYFKELGSLITVSQIKIFMNNPDGTNVAYRTDTKKPFIYNIGQVTREPVQIFTLQNAKGPLFQLEFTHSGTNVRPSLLGFELFYHVEGEPNA